MQVRSRRWRPNYTFDLRHRNDPQASATDDPKLPLEMCCWVGGSGWRAWLCEQGDSAESRRGRFDNLVVSLCE